MNLKGVCLAISQFLLVFSAFSQMDSTFKDSIKEITVYEYDTVYVEPDTIRLTDTIIDVIKINTQKGKEHSSNFSFSKFISFFSPIVPNSIGINISAFAAGYFRNERIFDTIVSQAIVDWAFSAQMNYEYKKYLFSLGAGYTSYHEKQSYVGYFSSTSTPTEIPGLTDSVLITKIYSLNYYYNYSNLYALIGRKWELARKWNFCLSAGIFTEFLSNFKQGNTSVMKSIVQKFNISITINPRITYHASQRMDLYLSPFYQHSFLQQENYPSNIFQKAGISLGCNINFNKS
jgi:hypothetical protein